MEKTAFTTPWGTFMYSQMPFDLMNVGATFQRDMDISFVGEKDKFVFIYLDGITILYKSNEEHIHHPRQVFMKCIRYGLSLNPKKSHFSIEKGEMLGHIVCDDGVKIDPATVISIQKFYISRT
jgi:hypothetical protein